MEMVLDRKEQQSVRRMRRPQRQIFEQPHLEPWWQIMDRAGRAEFLEKEQVKELLSTVSCGLSQYELTLQLKCTERCFVWPNCSPFLLRKQNPKDPPKKTRTQQLFFFNKQTETNQPTESPFPPAPQPPLGTKN